MGTVILLLKGEGVVRKPVKKNGAVSESLCGFLSVLFFREII